MQTQLFVIPVASVRRMSAEEGAAIWQQLTRGDWVVIDRLDDGHGRRLVLARFGGTRVRPWHLLSARERSVVALVAAGRSNPEIAEQLGISVSTVAGHLRALKRKLGGVQRLDLVREWAAANVVLGVGE